LNPPSKLFYVGALAMFLGLVAFTVSLIYGDNLVSSGVPCNSAPFTVPICAGLLVAIWAGLVMVPVGGGVAIYARFSGKIAKRIVAVQNRNPIVSRGLVVPAASILNLVGGLCSQLGITKLRPETLAYVWNNPRGGRYVTEMPADQAAFVKDKVCLSARLEGELELDEWKPILASSLIFYFSKSIRRKFAYATLIGFSWIPASLAFFILYSDFQPPPGSLLGGIIVIVVVMLIFVGLFGGWWWIANSTRRLWLASDKMTTEVVGRQELLRTLRRIDSMNLPEETPLERRKNFLIASMGQSNRPSVKERIRNLESVTY
jgi:hypothetical protein